MLIWAAFQRPVHAQVLNPATEEVIAEMCKCGGENATKAIDRAEAALPGWRKATAHRRSEFLLAWKAQIEKNTEDIAKIMTMECGKPLHEAKCDAQQSMRACMHACRCHMSDARLHGHRACGASCFDIVHIQHDSAVSFHCHATRC